MQSNINFFFPYQLAVDRDARTAGNAVEHFFSPNLCAEEVGVQTNFSSTFCHSNVMWLDPQGERPQKHTDAPIITCGSKTRRLTTHSHLLHATDGRCADWKNVVDMKPTGHYTNILVPACFGNALFPTIPHHQECHETNANFHFTIS
jgi:hypothetical protein